MGWRRQLHEMETEDWPWEVALANWWRRREEEGEGRMMEVEDGRWEAWTKERWQAAVVAEADVLWWYRKMDGWTGQRWRQAEEDWRRQLEERDVVEARNWQ